MKIRLFTGLLSLMIILSCEKDNDITQIESYAESARLKRVLLYSSIDSDVPINIVDEYEYDSLNRILKVSSPMYKDGEIVGTIKYDLYEYNSEGQLQKISNYNANIYATTGFINLKNYIYFYSGNGLKIKELIEYPQIASQEHSLFKYSDNQLVKVERYDHLEVLESYTRYEYNSLGEMVKETWYSADDEILTITTNTYTDGFNTLTEVYSGNQKSKIREIKKTYDSNGNLTAIESNELLLLSSLMSYVLRYEYYED